jgi:hypothetical protein
VRAPQWNARRPTSFRNRGPQGVLLHVGEQRGRQVAVASRWRLPSVVGRAAPVTTRRGAGHELHAQTRQIWSPDRSRQDLRTFSAWATEPAPTLNGPTTTTRAPSIGRAGCHRQFPAPGRGTPPVPRGRFTRATECETIERVFVAGIAVRDDAILELAPPRRRPGPRREARRERKPRHQCARPHHPRTHDDPRGARRPAGGARRAPRGAVARVGVAEIRRAGLGRSHAGEYSRYT